MPVYLRQSTAVDVAIGPFLDSTDGVTAETALTISQADVRLKKNNGAWAQVNDATAAAHEENGWYEKELDATDTNTVGRLLIAVHESGALPVWHEFCVLEEAIYDALFAASANAFTGAAGSTTLTALADGSITAAKIANGAIDAATFAADVDAEILSYLVDDATRIDASALNTASVTTIPAILVDTGTTLDGKIDTIDTNVDSILADTGTDGVVVAAASKTGYTLSSAGLADFFDTDSGTTYASAVAGSVVKEIADNAGGSALTEAGIADAVWDEAQASHTTAGSFGEIATEIAAILVDTGTTLDGKLDTIDTNVDSILVDTAEIGAAGAGLTAINLPDQTMNITGNITGNVSGSVGSVTAEVTANVKKINDVTITGDGSGTPFTV